ncbi:leucyl aminopeptidase family protein [Cellulomonas sp. S1-8]|uniref:leucyl aminopeptidase family protein n=1 Tax=Cellulomonas sp. S1-8 TaxID=2904790 RepID=UPI0022435B04|nr:leucyl aminopeptidase family protein [Cellulomonas sp. S1-8]UZN03795.1 leucyl aminopeptidase family protein [Cellulomonas sp. S1-8]
MGAVTIDVAVDTPDQPRVWMVAPDADLPDGLSWSALTGAGFTGAAGTVHVVAAETPLVLAGTGATPTLDDWRDAAGLGSRAASPHTDLAVRLPDDVTADVVRAVVEGTLLARYRYDALRAQAQGHRITRLTVVTGAAHDETAAAAGLGVASAGATALARDLANSPHNHLTAARFARIAVDLGAEVGLEVEVWEQQRCRDERLGGLLAINAGSDEEARFVRLRYVPSGAPTGRLALVGKGIMYDSGGIGLKPNNDSHAQMKNDMSGAAAVLAAMLALPATGGTAEVVGYLMCTDNMPSATAAALGDVARGRSGRTIEIVNTDAEGRVVMSDAFTLAVEDGVDAIVDIATLTGSVARAFGSLLSGITGSDDELVATLTAAANASGERVAPVPLEHRYRPQLSSPVADLRNLGPAGQPDGIISALFLHEFTEGLPWAHLDIAGTAWSTVDAGWQTPGCTGVGARTLLVAAGGFTA